MFFSHFFLLAYILQNNHSIFNLCNISAPGPLSKYEKLQNIYIFVIKWCNVKIYQQYLNDLMMSFRTSKYGIQLRQIIWMLTVQANTYRQSDHY